jgi:hypothetical protein
MESEETTSGLELIVSNEFTKCALCILSMDITNGGWVWLAPT